MAERRQIGPLVQAGPIEQVSQRAVLVGRAQLLTEERPDCPLCSQNRGGMKPDDLLCSRNARSKTPLVGRAQWKIDQPPSLRDDEQAGRGHWCLE